MAGSAPRRVQQYHRQAGPLTLNPGAHPGVLNLLADLHDTRQQQRVLCSHALPAAARLQPARPLQLPAGRGYSSALQAGGSHNLPY